MRFRPASPLSVFLGVLGASVVSSSVFAQGNAPDRFELGLRLRRLEQVVEKTTDAKARRRAVAILEPATASFFLGQTGKVGEMLDRARHALASDKAASPAVRFADSLRVTPGARVFDASATSLPLTVDFFYRAGSRPANAEVRLSLLPPGGRARATETFGLGSFPWRSEWKFKALPEGDYTFRSEVLGESKVLGVAEQTLSIVKNLSDRLAALRKGHAALKDKDTIEAATLGRLLSIFDDLAAKKTLETNYPVAGLLAQAELVLAAARAGKEHYGPGRPGQFWLTLVTGKEKDLVRLQVPNARKGTMFPLVVALHGAGGSDNMFFDAYGAGLVSRLAAERGWMVVAPRSPLALFGGGPDPVRIVDALARRYPIDKSRVFLVGHSMGAAQAVAAAGKQPKRFAAVAALGGGGRVGTAEGIKAVPFFVGVGAKDFALSGAQALDASLRKAGVKKVTFKKYDEVEHLLIVQLALRDVFKLFDGAAKASRQEKKAPVDK